MPEEEQAIEEKFVSKYEVLNVLTAHGIPYTVTSAGVVVDGFYKSDVVILKFYENRPYCIAFSRYEEQTVITAFYELAELNVKWWKNSNKSLMWKDPDPAWVEALLKLGLIKKKVLEVVTYE